MIISSLWLLRVWHSWAAASEQVLQLLAQVLVLVKSVAVQWMLLPVSLRLLVRL